MTVDCWEESEQESLSSLEQMRMKMLVNECSIPNIYCSPGHFSKAEGGVWWIPEFMQSVLLLISANSPVKAR